MSADLLQPRFHGTRFAELAGRFEAISALTDGWLDGRGRAPNKQKLAEISERMVGRYPDRVPLPIIAPTPEGNLLLEWNAPGDPSVDLHLDSMRAAFHAFLPEEQAFEREFLLLSDDAWGKFFDSLNKTLEHRPA